MMTPRTLERTTPRYRRGYRDGYAMPIDPLPLRPLTVYACDYQAGFKAGANDRLWDDSGDDNDSLYEQAMAVHQ